MEADIEDVPAPLYRTAEALEFGGPHKYHFGVYGVQHGDFSVDETNEPPWSNLTVDLGLYRYVTDADDYADLDEKLKPLLLCVRVFILVRTNHELGARGTNMLKFLKWKIHMQGKDSVVVQTMLENSTQAGRGTNPTWVAELGGFNADGWNTADVNRYRNHILLKQDLMKVSCETIWTGVHQAWTFFVGFLRLIMPDDPRQGSFYTSWAEFAQNRPEDSAPRLYIVVPQSSQCPGDGSELTHLGLRSHKPPLSIKMIRAGEERPYGVPIEEVTDAQTGKKYVAFIKFASVVQNMYDMTKISGSGIEEVNLPWEVQAFYFTLRSLCHQNKNIRIIYYKDGHQQQRFDELVVDCIKEDISSRNSSN